MRRRAARRHRASRWRWRALGLRLPACGTAGGDRSGRRAPRRPAPSAASALKRIGSFDDPVYVTGAPGLPEAALRRRAAGQGRGAARRPRAAAGPSSTSAAWSARRRRARPALDRLPARLRAAAGASTSTTPTTRATSGSTNSSAAAPTRAARGSRRAGDRDPPPGQRQPQRRPAAVPRQPPLLRHRRRRLRRRPAQQRPEQGRACSASCCGSTRGPRGGRPYSVPADNPFVGKPGPRRDLQLRPAQPVPLLLRHGQRRAAADRDRRRRPEPLRGARLHDRRAAPAAPTSAGTPSRASPPTREENSGTPDPGGTTKPIFAYPPQPRRQLLDHRRLRGRATAACRSLLGRYVYADLCEGQLRSLVPHLKRASGDRKLGLAVASPTSFGEDDRHRSTSPRRKGRLPPARGC